PDPVFCYGTRGCAADGQRSQPGPAHGHLEHGGRGRPLWPAYLRSGRGSLGRAGGAVLPGTCPRHRVGGARSERAANFADKKKLKTSRVFSFQFSVFSEKETTGMPLIPLKTEH